MASDAIITRIIELGRSRMIARETVVTQGLLDAYEDTWRRIDRELRVLQAQYRHALAQGIAPPTEWLTRQAYWYGLQASIEEEMVRFQGTAARILEAGQRMAVTEARDTARLILEDLGLSGAGGRLRPETMERWISARQPGSPLRGVLDRYPKGVLDTIEHEITEGLGMGRGSSTVLRRIRDEIGPDAMTPRINTLVRTEMHRTYRGAQKTEFDEFKARGIITHYQWHASFSLRTCGACLAMHGRIFDEYPMHQHPNCRCTVRPIVNPEYLPGGSREARSGEEWLRNQPEKRQLAALGSVSRLEAFRSGDSLESMVMIRPNETWGPSVGLTRPGGGGRLPGTPRWRDQSNRTRRGAA